MIDVGTPDWEMSKMFRTVLTREKPPEASTGPVVEKSSNQPKSSGV